MVGAVNIMKLLAANQTGYARVVAALLIGAFQVLGVAPVAAEPPQKRDTALAEKALAAAKKNNWTEYKRFAARLKNADVRAVLRWNRLRSRNSGAGFHELAMFLKTGADWPRLALIRRRAEEAIPASLPDQAILDWFNGRPPLTSAGGAALAGALINLGRKDEARELLRKVWVSGAFGAQQERQFYKRFRRHLTRENHIQRLDQLLWNGQHYAVRRMYRRVNPDYRALAQARVALRRHRGGVDRAIQRVPEKLINDTGLIYERLRWRRRKGRDEQARALLGDVPDDLVRPRRWWREREILVRRALRDGHISAAYRIAKHHGQDGGPGFAEGEWLAGWIALRFLGDTDIAFGHFNNLYRIAKYPISRARGAYWSARAAAVQDKGKQSRVWYGRAAKFPTTFYGQMASHKIGDTHNFTLPRALKTVDGVAADFAGHELVRMVLAMKSAKLQGLMRPFFRHLSSLNNSPSWLAETARLAQTARRPDLAVLVAKVGLAKGINLVEAGYPRLPPGLLNYGLERPLIHALIRQESAFNLKAISHAGARGLMQLMPATAKRVAKRHRITYRKSRLVEDAGYNLRIGQTFLKELLARYNNSYVLTLAAYNAGPSRVRRWIKLNGDPRDPSVDAIDWIELIPFSETRNYVQRVLENLHIYRELADDNQMAFNPEALLRR
jgi:soluble lytic murein transglycosylase